VTFDWQRKERTAIVIGLTKLDNHNAAILVGRCVQAAPWHSACHLPHAIVHFHRIKLMFKDKRRRKAAANFLEIRKQKYRDGETRDAWSMCSKCNNDLAAWARTNKLLIEMNKFEKRAAASFGRVECAWCRENVDEED